MAKRNHKQSIARQGNQQVVQTSYEEDDNMIPPPDMLKEYHELDPNFIDWIKTRADLEQKSRIKFNDDRLRLAKNANSKMFTIDIAVLLVSGFLIFCSLYLTKALIESGHYGYGTLLGGGALFALIVRLLNFRRKKSGE